MAGQIDGRDLLDPPDLNGSEATKDVAPKQLRALFGAFLAIQGVYLSQLVKDKD